MLLQTSRGLAMSRKKTSWPPQTVKARLGGESRVRHESENRGASQGRGASGGQREGWGRRDRESQSENRGQPGREGRESGGRTIRQILADLTLR
jgi:hypothetical protein